MTLHLLHTPGRYLGQVRPRGGRRWRTVTGTCQTAERALARAVAQMSRADQRARALWVGDEPCYYDPHVAMEAHRR